jgi:hypothetical protein
MNKKMAGLLFLGSCVVLAALLATKVISPVVSGSFFAIALVSFGILSRGFQNKK